MWYSKTVSYRAELFLDNVFYIFYYFSTLKRGWNGNASPQRTMPNLKIIYYGYRLSRKARSQGTDSI